MRCIPLVTLTASYILIFLFLFLFTFRLHPVNSFISFFRQEIKLIGLIIWRFKNTVVIHVYLIWSLYSSSFLFKVPICCTGCHLGHFFCRKQTANPKHKQFTVFVRLAPLRRNDPAYPRGTSLLRTRANRLSIYLASEGEISLRHTDSVSNLARVIRIIFAS